MASTIRILHYLNQFFGQIGGEEKAGVGVQVKEGPIGPGRAMEQLLEGKGVIIATIICGDNTFAEQQETIVQQVLEIAETFKPDLFIAGPAFNAGRYGVACGLLCKEIQEKLKIPAVTGMYEENPAVEMYSKDVYIIRTLSSAKKMLESLRKIIQIGRKLLNEEEIGNPEEEGYFPQGHLRNIFSTETGAQRAINVLLLKLRKETYQTEIPLPIFDPVIPAEPIIDFQNAVILLATDGGLVPKGNPDKIESLAATKFGAYEIKELMDLSNDQYEINHVGYNSEYVKENPNRLVPLDSLRDLEKEGVIGKVFDYFISTTGVATSYNYCRRIGQQIGSFIKQNGITGVILTST